MTKASITRWPSGAAKETCDGHGDGVGDAEHRFHPGDVHRHVPRLDRSRGVLPEAWPAPVGSAATRRQAMDVTETTPPPMDLTPRPVDPAAAAPKRRNNRKWVSIAVLVLVVAGGAVVLTKFLTSSLDYYCNVDEVGHKSGCEQGRQFRVQGTVD